MYEGCRDRKPTERCGAPTEIFSHERELVVFHVSGVDPVYCLVISWEGMLIFLSSSQFDNDKFLKFDL